MFRFLEKLPLVFGIHPRLPGHSLNARVEKNKDKVSEMVDSQAVAGTLERERERERAGGEAVSRH